MRFGAAPLIVGIALLSGGIAFAVVGARRLRFFFGRGRPASLAPEVAIGATGNSQAADYYKTMLRQGGIEYPEPLGALNGVLYHAAPRLITAPRVVQELAQKHFFNALALLVTFASFLFGQPVVFLQGLGNFQRGIRGNSGNAYVQDTIEWYDCQVDQQCEDALQHATESPTAVQSGISAFSEAERCQG